jgi:1-acyl-sn-glycerol-3-phosphate acyltransferase
MHPNAGNPGLQAEYTSPGMADELAQIKPQVYKDPRPASHFDRYHERARRRRPDWVYVLARLLLTPYLLIVHRARCIGSDHVPITGPVVVAPNHFSFMDHFFLGVFLRRYVRFMAKSQLFTPPLQFIFFHGGVFPVRRGHRDEEAFKTAELILRQGGLVAIYPEAGRSRTGKLAEHAKPGVGRLALDSGAPVVPVAIHGTLKARNWKRLQFPKVTILFGEPVTFPAEAGASRQRHQEVADAIFDRVKDLYAQLDRDGRKGVVRRDRQRRAARRGARAATT